jgi:hypothetical protein
VLLLLQAAVGSKETSTQFKTLLVSDKTTINNAALKILEQNPGNHYFLTNLLVALFYLNILERFRSPLLTP